MTDQHQASGSQPVEQASSAKMIFALTLISVLSGITVVLVYLFTLPIIEENKRLAIEAAVLKVIPEAKSFAPLVASEEGLFPVDEGQPGQVFYLGFDKAGQPVGLASPTNAQGYADKVYIIYGYRFDCQCITGIEVIKHAETPGLGDKILTDPDFQANFRALDASLNAGGSALENAIVTVKHGSKTNPWEVDAISGATITSRAVGRALNIGAQQLLPQVNRFNQQLEAYKP